SLPVAIENDVNACALAEKMFGCCKDSTDFIWLTVSNGCGGALFLSNALYKGFGGTAGEIGHIVVEENNGFQCGCGNSGCLEIQAAGPGIVRRYLQKTPGESLTAADIASKAREGDANALKVYRDEGKYLGYAIASAVNLLNPERVIIGGGVSASFDLFADTLRETVMQRIYQSANKTLIIETSALGYNASLIGAASLALV
ncbi:MAG: ROK family protein, partial [Clostridia bacterium]|nr:ROK family protein [Clostridia bacterium]